MLWTAGIAGLVVGAIWFGQRSLMYVPDRNDPGSVVGVIEGGRDVELSTSDGLTLRSWLIEPGPATDRHVGVLYLPGNGGNRGGRVEVARALVDAGFTVLMLDYRGFGGNPGRPSEDGLLRDATAGLATLHEAGFDQDRILYVGESLGTGVATALATAEPAPAGVLLRSPFTSFGDVATASVTGGIPVGPLLRDRYDTLSRIGSIEAPVTVLAGSADSVIPVEQSRQVAESAGQLHAFIEVPGADHNDALWFGPFLALHVSALADVAVHPSE